MAPIISGGVAIVQAIAFYFNPESFFSGMMFLGGMLMYSTALVVDAISSRREN